MIRILLSIIVSAICYSAAICQSEQLVINLEKSSVPGLLTFENPKGSIKITGYDGEVILATGTLRFTEPVKTDGNGMRRIGQNSLDFSAEVNGTSVIFYSRATGKTVDFDIKVPRNISLKLKSLDNGDIEVVNINGEIEIENANGNISITNIAGSAVLSSVYGKISAGFRDVNPASPMMFTSLEGNITIVFPSAVNARLKMKSEKGEILSDFDIKPVNRQPVVKSVESKHIYSLEDWIVCTINEGGPEYIIKSYNGDIILRKR